MKRIFYPFVVLGLLILGAVICFKPLDKTPYQQTDFYKKEIALIDSVVNISNSQSAIRNDLLEVGWSSVNLLPPFPTPIAIDAHRNGKHFEGVHDSVYVRAFVFKQGKTKVAYVSADLLVIPPTVTKIFDTILHAEGYNTSNIFFTATHTHSSIGSWYDSYVGEKFAGKFDERVPKHIASCISKAILEAEGTCSPAKSGYAEFPTHQLVYNRLIADMAQLPDSLGKLDSLLRMVKIEKETGERAAIVTFSAHCTIYHEYMMNVSGDWAGLLTKQLNASGKINFSSFSAGAVGSHGPFPSSLPKNTTPKWMFQVYDEQDKGAKYMADRISKIILENFDSISTDTTTTLQMLHLPLYLRQPNLRVTDNFVLRPWLFKKLFGDERAYINTLRVGNIVFTGVPCDFSGELVNEIVSEARKKNLKLLVTSFNGGFIGYITDDKWYRLDTYETRLMNWFGPENGRYLSEIITRLL